MVPLQSLGGSKVAVGLLVGLVSFRWVVGEVVKWGWGVGIFHASLIRAFDVENSKSQ